MNLQQLRYIIALDRFRNFAKAAEACRVSQPTLSAMLVKLEEELDVRLFERSNKSVVPTTVGAKIVRQAQRALMETERIGEIVAEDKDSIGGSFTLSVGPTIAPYILPKFIRHYREDYPAVDLTIREMKVQSMQDALLDGEVDAAIAISDNARQGWRSTRSDFSCIWPKAAGASSRCLNQKTWSTKICGLCVRRNAYATVRSVSAKHAAKDTTSTRRGASTRSYASWTKTEVSPSSRKCTCRFSLTRNGRTCGR